MAFPSSFLDEVIAHTDIVSVVSDYVKLSRSGSQYKGLCPFHGEKTPSFSVSQEKKLYHCFGCKAGGNVINFIEQAENLDFIPAVEFLANRAGLSMPQQSYESNRDRAKEEKILQINRLAARYYYDNLQSPMGAVAREYLAQRKLSPQMMTKFGLGYALDEWSGLIDTMAQHNIDQYELMEAGFVSKSEKTGKLYDRFRNRVMFPIINVKKEVIGFGGRALDEQGAKYMNSPDTIVYNKSRNLYGLNLAKQAKGTGILCEGNLDTITMHQFGFTGAVSTMGTALTEGQAKLLKRYFKDVVIAYDNDPAGKSATDRAIPILTKEGIDVRVIQLVDAKDPDEFLHKHGSHNFVNLLNQSMHHIDFRLLQLKNRFQLEDNNHRVQFLQEVSLFISKMESPVQREIYATKVGEWVSVSKDAILLEVDGKLQEEKNKAKRQLERKVMNPASVIYQQSLYQCTRASRGETNLLAVCLAEPSFLSELDDFSAEVFSVPLLGKVFDIIKERYKRGEAIDLAYLAGDFTQEEMSQLTSVILVPTERETLRLALEENLNVMEEEYDKRTLQGEDKLLALQKQMQERQERI